MAKGQTRQTYPYRPDYAVPPGWLFMDYLEAWDYTPADFAQRHSLPAESVEGVLAGTAPLDTELAAVLEREFGLEASFWLDLEVDYRRRLAEMVTPKWERTTLRCQNSTGAVIMTTPIFKRIVCLANSRKMSGRCIAGKELLDDGKIGGWIRPVSARETEEVSEWERQYVDGSDPRLLDVIDVPLLYASPKSYQQENWLLAPEYYWEKVRLATATELPQFTDPAPPLWTDGYSTVNGHNDRIPLDQVSTITDSLRLVKVENLELQVSQPGMDFGNYRRRVQGRFRHNGVDYWLRVTDPVYERQYLQKPNGQYPMGECFLTVSLGEPFHGYAYKLIAAIIKP